MHLKNTFQGKINYETIVQCYQHGLMVDDISKVEVNGTVSHGSVRAGGTLSGHHENYMGSRVKLSLSLKINFEYSET